MILARAAAAAARRRIQLRCVAEDPEANLLVQLAVALGSLLRSCLEGSQNCIDRSRHGNPRLSEMLVALAANAPSLVVHSTARSLALASSRSPLARHLSVAMAETASPADALRSLDDDCGCDDVTPAKTVLVNDVVVSAASLRSLTLADAAGRPTRAGELIGDDGAAVVCFLRHLG